MRLIFSGGGTGGHIYPAIAVAQEILKRHPGTEILFIGAMGRMEMEKVPKAGFPIKGLWISGLQRKLTWQNALFPVKLSHSLWKAYRIVRAFKPSAVAGFGGYASGAALFVASGMGVPTLIQEQNSYPGLTNKILGKRVDRICIAYEEARRFFPSERVMLTGNPVRKSLEVSIDRRAARKHFGLDPDKKTALIVGGSLGARSINEAIRWSFDDMRDDERIQFIWQCGRLYYDEYKVCNMANLSHVKLLDFIDNMDQAYAAADLVVSRAGALTISELTIAGKPSVLVPSPNVAEDHQTKNAAALVNQQAALTLSDSEVQRKLPGEIRRILGDEDLLKKLTENIRSMRRPDAAEKIAIELLSLVKTA